MSVDFTKNELYTEEATHIFNDLHQQESEDSGSIIVVLMIISIIVSVMRLLQGCRKTPRAVKQFALTAMGNRNLDEILRKHLTEEQYNAHGKDLKNLLLYRGTYIENNRLQTMMALTAEE